MPRFAHTADPHVDNSAHATTPLLRRRMWMENAAALSSVVTGAVEHDVDCLIVAGDDLHNGRPTPEAMMLYVESLRPALEAKIPVVLLRGNHALLGLRSGQRTAMAVLREMLSDYGEVHVVDDGPRLVRTASGLLVGCQPWIDADAMLQQAGMLDADETAQNDFVAHEAVNVLAGLVEQAGSEPLVLASHIAASGAKRGSERDLTALFREPVVSGSELAGLGASYVALGHLHAPQELAAGVWYSGSPQRFTFTDETDTKGFNLVDVADDGTLLSIQRVPTVQRAMQTIDLAAESVDVAEDALIRVRLAEGETEVPPETVAAIEEAGSRLVGVLRTQPLVAEAGDDDREQLAETIDTPTALRAWLAENHPDADADAVVKLAASLSSSDHQHATEGLSTCV